MITPFLNYIRTILETDAIRELYYGLNYWEHTDGYLERDSRFTSQELAPYLKRYHERVFCYEFYHQLRIRMDLENREDGQNLFISNHVYLQSEVIKQNIQESVIFFEGISPLNKRYMPDFILHTPGNFSNQLLIMEVKSNPRLNFAELSKDLKKIQEFINKYRYELGIFIAVNQSDEQRENLLNEISVWQQVNINTPDQILLIFKNGPRDQIFEYTLAALQ